MKIKSLNPGRSKERKMSDAHATRSEERTIPKLLEFLGLHLGIGVALGVVFASLIVVTNASGLKDLVVNSQEPIMVLALLYGLNALTFGSLAMGVGVMSLPMDEVCDMREKDDQDK